MLSLSFFKLETEADKQRFTEIYLHNHDRIAKVAMRILKNKYDTEDAVQSTFVQIIRHFEKVYEIPCKDLPFWCISIVKNEAYLILRSNRKTVQIEDWDATVEGVDMISDYKDLVNLFNCLPLTYRTTLEMKFLLNYSAKEISQKLNISEAAVHTRISRGRALLRAIAEKEGFHA